MIETIQKYRKCPALVLSKMFNNQKKMPANSFSPKLSRLSATAKTSRPPRSPPSPATTPPPPPGCTRRPTSRTRRPRRRRPSATEAACRRPLLPRLPETLCPSTPSRGAPRRTGPRKPTAIRSVPPCSSS